MTLSLLSARDNLTIFGMWFEGGVQHVISQKMFPNGKKDRAPPDVCAAGRSVVERRAGGQAWTGHG